MTITEVCLSIPLHACIFLRVAEHLGASSRRPRHPFPALMAGETPGREPVHTALKTQDSMPCRHNNRHVTTDKELHLCKTTLMVMTPYR